MSFLAQGGGHGYSPTLGVIQNALMISLHQFNKAVYNPADQTVTVGGAANFSTLSAVLYEAGRELSTSTGVSIFGRRCRTDV
jgi:fumiquinazoline A oxidase